MGVNTLNLYRGFKNRDIFGAIGRGSDFARRCEGALGTKPCTRRPLEKNRDIQLAQIWLRRRLGDKTETSCWARSGCGVLWPKVCKRYSVGRNSAVRLLETKLKLLKPGEQDVLLFNMCLKSYLEHHRHLEHHNLRSKEEISGAFCRPQMYFAPALWRRNTVDFRIEPCWDLLECNTMWKAS